MFGSQKQIVHVEGMMCMHCAGHVQDALEKLEGVKKVVVSLEKKTATVTVKSPLDEETYRAAIEGAGYQFVGLE